MPLTAAAGSLSLAQEALARSLATCESFQDMLEYGGASLGADPEAGALLRIHHDDVQPGPANGTAYTTDELLALRPYALTSTARRGSLRLARRATGTYPDSGKLELHLARGLTDVQAAAGDAEIARIWQNQLGTILQELCELSDDISDQYLIVKECLVVGFGRVHEDDVPNCGDFVCADIDLLWGVD